MSRRALVRWLRPPGSLLLGALLALPGCLTPSMGRETCELLGLDERPASARATPSCSETGLFEGASLPRRIWYVDPVAQIYHERLTNTFVRYEPASKAWVATTSQEAWKEFRPDRAKLLVSGAPREVEKVVDYLVEMEPGWRGI